MINSTEQLHCGSPWLLRGQNPSLAQGCHLLVDPSCSSDMYIVDQEKKRRRGDDFCTSFLSLLVQINPPDFLPLKKETDRPDNKTCGHLGI